MHQQTGVDAVYTRVHAALEEYWHEPNTLEATLSARIRTFRLLIVLLTLGGAAAGAAVGVLVSEVAAAAIPSRPLVLGLMGTLVAVAAAALVFYTTWQLFAHVLARDVETALDTLGVRDSSPFSLVDLLMLDGARARALQWLLCATHVGSDALLDVRFLAQEPSTFASAAGLQRPPALDVHFAHAFATADTARLLCQNVEITQRALAWQVLFFLCTLPTQQTA